jgi:uncharacterized protein (DUF488 family)
MSHIPLHTIGYGARDLDRFLAVLREQDISFVVDVRSRPYSRYKPDFSKEALQQHLHDQQMRYIFLGEELGGRPDDPSCYDADGKVNYALCAQREAYRAGIDRLREAYRLQLRVVLMCSEGKPESCHRTKLIAETLTKEGIPVLHIDENDALITHEEAMLRVIHGQPSLFGDDFFDFTSRKQYREPGTEDGTE